MKFTCNQCGETSELGFPTDVYGLKDVRVSGGYFSEELLDMTGYTFSLCEGCLRKMFDGFKVKPSVTNQDYESYDAEREIWLWNRWIRSGGREEKFPTGKCTATKECANKAVYRAFTGGMRKESSCEEHCPTGWCLSEHMVPIKDLVGIPEDPADRTYDHKKQIADAFLKVVAPRKEVLHFQYIDDVIIDLLEREPKFGREPGSELGGVWFPLCCSEEVLDKICKRSTWLLDNGAFSKDAGLKMGIFEVLLTRGSMMIGDVSTMRDLAKSVGASCPKRAEEDEEDEA